jgi:hypothetical protein
MIFANRLYLKKKTKKGMLILICIPSTVVGFTLAPSNLILSNQFITDLKRLNVLYDFITNDIAG